MGTKHSSDSIFRAIVISNYMNYYKSIKIRLYPNKTQEKQMKHTLDCSRWIWNHMLALNIKEYNLNKKFIFNFQMQKLLIPLRKEYGWLSKAATHALSRVCYDLDHALRNCFKFDMGFPKFKKKNIFEAKYYVHNGTMRIINNKINLSKLGYVKFRGKTLSDKIMSATISLDGDKWYLSIMYECDQYKQDFPIGEVGIDLGIKSFAVTSDGEVVDNPHFLKNQLRKLKKLQRKQARTKKGSNRRQKANLRIRKCHRKIANKRNDFLHKFTTDIVKNNGLICIEDLNINGMMKNHNLSLAISELGLYEFKRQLKYKSAWNGCQLVEIPRFYPSSKTCSCCGKVKTKLALHERLYSCEHCGHEMDRDLNAAINILKVGQAMSKLEHENALKARGESSTGREATTASIRHDSMNREQQDYADCKIQALEVSVGG